MKTLLVAALTAVAVPVLAADVGVSIGFSQPGVYGRIDIGRFPQPVLIVPQPVLIVQPRAVVVRPEPVYLWVPPGHRQNWRRHCGRYNACGVPVYFVQERWYQQQVMAERGDRRDKRDKQGKHDKHDKRDKHDQREGPGRH